MIPRSWNDFGAEPFSSTSVTLVEMVAGIGSGGDREEGSVAGFAPVGLIGVDAVFLARFECFRSS